MLKVGRKRFEKIYPEFPSRKQWNKNTWLLYLRKVKNLQEISREYKDQKHCCCDFFRTICCCCFITSSTQYFWMDLENAYIEEA